MPTNGEIMSKINALESRMDGFDARMTTYENQAAENTRLLKEVKGGIDFLKGSLKLVRWAGIAICSAALWQVGTTLYHLLFH